MIKERKKKGSPNPGKVELKKLSKAKLIKMLQEQQKTLDSQIVEKEKRLIEPTEAFGPPVNSLETPHHSEVFTAARENVEMLLTRLESSEVLGWEHGDVESLIQKDGTEILRYFLQGHLDLRGLTEERRTEVKGIDGIVRTYCREDCKRQLMSLFGEVIVTRKGYATKDLNSYFPLDAELNLPPDKYSHGLQIRVATEVSKNSFDEAVESVTKTTGGKVPKRQAEEVAVKVSQDFETFYAQNVSAEPELTPDPLILTSDAKGIVMNKLDLREATRKSAEKQQADKSKKRLGTGEKKNRKRMAMVGSVYDVAPYIRSAEQIMGLEEDAGSKPRARNKRVWASVERDAEVVIDEIFQEALRQDPLQLRPWVFLIDGHEDQLRMIRTAAKRYEVEITIILDFIHMVEYLWKASYCFYPAGSQDAEDWVTERALWVLQGKVSNVAAGIRRKATLHDLSKDARKAADKCADYFLKYKDLLRCDEYLKQGYPIATGVIEGACRHLIGDRMDITGARWRLKRAEAVLKLRSLRASGDDEAYWEFHKAQSKQRNHADQESDYSFLKAA